MKKDNDLYIIRKYVFAKSAEEAIKKDKTSRVNEVWIDEEYRKKNLDKKIDDQHEDKKSFGY